VVGLAQARPARAPARRAAGGLPARRAASGPPRGAQLPRPMPTNLCTRWPARERSSTRARRTWWGRAPRSCGRARTSPSLCSRGPCDSWRRPAEASW